MLVYLYSGLFNYILVYTTSTGKNVNIDSSSAIGAVINGKTYLIEELDPKITDFSFPR
jgi:hypothetical protein